MFAVMLPMCLILVLLNPLLEVGFFFIHLNKNLCDVSLRQMLGLILVLLIKYYCVTVDSYA